MTNILLVDDDPDIQETVNTILTNEGYTVTIAKNADDCLQKLNQGKPDLILLDIMMPGTPIKEIIPKIKDIKIALITAVRMSEAEKEELFTQENIIGFIQKPFKIDKLIAEVKELVEK